MVGAVPFNALTVIVVVATASTGTSFILPCVPIGSVARGYDAVPPPLYGQLNCSDSLAILTVDTANLTPFVTADTKVCGLRSVEGMLSRTWTVNVFVVQSNTCNHLSDA